MQRVDCCIILQRMAHGRCQWQRPTHVELTLLTVLPAFRSSRKPAHWSRADRQRVAAQARDHLRAAVSPVGRPVPRSISLDPRSISLDPRSISLDPRSISLDPRSISLDPRSISSDPRSISLDPRSISPVRDSI